MKRLYLEAKAANDGFKKVSAIHRRQGGLSANLEKMANKVQKTDAELNEASIELRNHPQRDE